MRCEAIVGPSSAPWILLPWQLVLLWDSQTGAATLIAACVNGASTHDVKGVGLI